jgi:hypothetical protein
MVTVAGLPAITCVPGVVIISAVPFELAVAGSPAVVGFPAVDGVLVVASIPAHPGVPILAGRFTSWTERYWITRLSDYTVAIGLLLISAIWLSEYRISDWRFQETIGLLDIESWPQPSGLLIAHLCQVQLWIQLIKYLNSTQNTIL